MTDADDDPHTWAAEQVALLLANAKRAAQSAPLSEKVQAALDAP